MHDARSAQPGGARRTSQALPLLLTISLCVWWELRHRPWPLGVTGFVRWYALLPVLSCWVPLGVVAVASARRALSPLGNVWRKVGLLSSLTASTLAVVALRNDLDPRAANALIGFSLGVAIASALASRLHADERPAPGPPSFAGRVFSLSALVCAIDAVIQYAFRQEIQPIEDRFHATQAWLEVRWIELFLAYLIVSLGRVRAVIGIGLLLLPHLFRTFAPEYWQLWKWMFVGASVLPLFAGRTARTDTTATARASNDALVKQ